MVSAAGMVHGAHGAHVDISDEGDEDVLQDDGDLE